MKEYGKVPISLVVLVERAMTISASSAYGPHSCANTLNATARGGGNVSTVCLTFRYSLKEGASSEDSLLRKYS